jgi:phospholipid-binding lipoprotein MlaA
MSSAFQTKLAGVTLAAVMTLGLGGCATAPSDSAAKAEFEQANDPLEPFNRAVFAVNMQLDKMLLRPAGIVYRGVLPKPVQTGVNNFLGNLRAPVVFANDVLQGDIDRAGNTAGRFAINTTVGVLGVWDAAAHFGIHGHSEDFGQTFGTWGIGEGFYLVLPLLGPSNPRDGIGLLAEYFVDPFNIWARGQDEDGLILARSVPAILKLWTSWNAPRWIIMPRSALFTVSAAPMKFATASRPLISRHPACQMRLKKAKKTRRPKPGKEPGKKR